MLAGRYRLDAHVGRGGMADVYRGTDELLHRTVAVKVFRLGAADRSEQRRIDGEIHTLAELRHPGLVTLYDASLGSEGDPPFLVMEYVPGTTLAERITRGRLDPGEVATLGAQLAAALAQVHARGVVHRDVKPANILLDEHADPPQAKLTDFGIARITDDTRITADGLTMGTANYVSPEQARGALVTPASDIYSLGLVLIESATGEISYPGTALESVIARMSRPPAIPQTLGRDWTGLLAAMTAFDPHERPSATAAAAALGRLQQESAPAEVVGTAIASAAAGTAIPSASADTAITTAMPVAEAQPNRTHTWMAAAARHRRPLLVGGAAAALAAALILGLTGGLGSAGSTSGIPANQPTQTQAHRTTPLGQSTAQTPTAVAVRRTPTPRATSKAARPPKPAHTPKPKPPAHSKPAPAPAPGSTPTRVAPTTAAPSTP